MHKEEVIEIIGKERWKEFCEFMYGQTVSTYSDGSTYFYTCDVENFLRKPKDRFFD